MMIEKARLNRANIAQRYWEVYLPKDASHTKKVEDYINNIDENRRNGKGLIFWGGFFSGKTSLASLILIKALEKHYKCYSLYSFDINRIYYNQQIERFSEEKSLWQRILEVDFLLIDDFGTHQSSDIMEKIIRYRFDDLKVTLLTINDKSILKGDKSNDGIFKRIASCNKLIKVDGKDWLQDGQ